MIDDFFFFKLALSLLILWRISKHKNNKLHWNDIYESRMIETHWILLSVSISSYIVNQSHWATQVCWQLALKVLKVLDTVNSQMTADAWAETRPPWRPNAQKSIHMPLQHAASFLLPDHTLAVGSCLSVDLIPQAWAMNHSASQQSASHALASPFYFHRYSFSAPDGK